MSSSLNANGKNNDSAVNVQSIVLSKLIDDPQMKEMIVMEVINICLINEFHRI